MRIRTTWLLLALLPLAGASAQTGRALDGSRHEARVGPLGDKIHPQMRRLVAERGPSKAWIFFTDKGLDSSARAGDSLRAQLRRFEAGMNPRQRERRRQRRTTPGLCDVRDLPVVAEYVRATEATGATVVVETSWLNAVSVHASEAQLESIARLPFVDRIEPVRRGVLVDGLEAERQHLHGSGPSAQRGGFYGETEEQLDQLNLLPVHRRGYTGKGVVIGILDTGFHRGHEAFNQPGHVVDVLAEWDFIDDDGDTDIETGDPSSQHSHGTLILGTIGAYLPGSLIGGAYEASFVLAKTEDTTNEYEQEEDFYVSGLQFIEAHGGDLATSSLGYIDWYTQSDLDGLTAVTTIGVNTATDNGLLCVTVAGNSFHDTDPGTSALLAPGDAFQVFTCGAVDSAGTIAGFSSDGPTADGRVKPELCARGVDTRTVCSFTDTNCTTGANGTSLSTPLVTAALACLVQARPERTIAGWRSRLFPTGDYFLANGTFDPEFVYGYGVPDVALALFGRPRSEPTTEPLR